VVHGLVRIEVEPALTTQLLVPRVPRQPEALEPAARKLNQVLLQGVPAEGVADGIIPQLAVGAVRMHHEASVAAKEARAYAVGQELRVLEVAEDGIGARLPHRQVVVGPLPELVLLLMTLPADPSAYVAPLGARRIESRI